MAFADEFEGFKAWVLQASCSDMKRLLRILQRDFWTTAMADPLFKASKIPPESNSALHGWITGYLAGAIAMKTYYLTTATITKSRDVGSLCWVDKEGDDEQR